MKIPRSAPPDVQQAFRDIEKSLEALQGHRGQVDLQGRRIGGAGDPVSPGDYVTKSVLDRALTTIRNSITRATTRSRRPTLVTGGGGGGGGSSSVDFGYYRVDGFATGQWESAVRSYTNIAYTGSIDGGVSDTPSGQRLQNFRQVLARLTTAGFSLMLDVESGQGRLTIDGHLEAAAPHWDKIKYIILGEIDLDDPDTTNDLIQELKDKITDLGLVLRPIGFTADFILDQNVSDYNFDFVNLTAYSPNIPCPSDPTQAVLEVKNSLISQMSQVPATKFLTVVMQGYTRNGACASIEAMKAINKATWFDMIKGNSQVKAIVIFAYVFGSGGTNQFPELIAIHQDIWRDITGGTTPVPGSAKKCIGDIRGCVGQEVCCEGGASNPCNCPRLCEGGLWMIPVENATVAAVTANPALFSTLTPPTLLSAVAAETFKNLVVAGINLTNPDLKALADPSDGKQVWIRLRTSPQHREDFRVWNTDLTVAFPSGSGYRASCFGVDLSW